jgi:hypothetical protein
MISTSGLSATIFVFPLPVTSGIIHNRFFGMLDPENMGFAVEIALLSGLQAEI